MQRLRVGLIGAGGGISGLRGKAVLAHAKAEVVLCHQRSEKRLARVHERYPGLPVTRDPAEVISADDIDAVIISTPNSSHFELARAALEQRKHVCVDYPLVQTVAEYDELVSLAQGQGLVLHDGLTPSIENYHLAVKDALARIGEPLSAYCRYFIGKTGWYWKEAEAGDIFLILTIHQLAHLHDLLGPVQRVYATVSDTQVETGVVRVAQATFSFANGVTAVIENGWGLAKHPGMMYRVVGSEGTASFAEVDRAYRLEVQRVGADLESTETKLDFGAVLTEDTDNFLDQILEGAEPIVPLETGRELLNLCRLASRSATEGLALEA